MKVLLTTAFFLALVSLVSCEQQQQEDSASVPQTSSQEPGPVLVEHGKGWDEYHQSLDELSNIKDTIEYKYSELSRQEPPAPGEPVFSDQKTNLREEILRNCDTLESRAQELLSQPYLQEHKGQGVDAEGLVRYAQEIREKVQAGN
jgi:hypothetical protein